jgi:hypothetical protein
MPISFHHKCVLMTVGFLPVLWRPIATAWPTTICIQRHGQSESAYTFLITDAIHLPMTKCTLTRNSSALSPCRAGRGRGRAPSRPSTEMFTEEEEVAAPLHQSALPSGDTTIVAPVYLPCHPSPHA